MTNFENMYGSPEKLADLIFGKISGLPLNKSILPEEYELWLIENKYNCSGPINITRDSFIQWCNLPYTPPKHHSLR